MVISLIGNLNPFLINISSTSGGSLRVEIIVKGEVGSEECHSMAVICIFPESRRRQRKKKKKKMRVSFRRLQHERQELNHRSARH